MGVMLRFGGHSLHQQDALASTLLHDVEYFGSGTLTASSLSLMLSRVSEISAGMAVLQKEVILLKPPYVMMGMIPAGSHASPVRMNSACLLVYLWSWQWSYDLPWYVCIWEGRV